MRVNLLAQEKNRCLKWGSNSWLRSTHWFLGLCDNYCKVLKPFKKEICSSVMCFYGLLVCGIKDQFCSKVTNYLGP